MTGGTGKTGSAGQNAREILEAIEMQLPGDATDAALVATAVCAARCIDAGMDDDDAVAGLSAALNGLRARGAGEGRH